MEKKWGFSFTVRKIEILFCFPFHKALWGFAVDRALVLFYVWSPPGFNMHPEKVLRCPAASQLLSSLIKQS